MSETAVKSQRRWLRVSLICLTFGSIAILLVGLLVVAGPHFRRQNQLHASYQKLKFVGLALLNYESTYGRFPPQILYGANGEPFQGWRGILTPQMEAHMGSDLFFNSGIPWNASENLPFTETAIAYYCADGSADKQAMTIAVAGTGFLFDGSTAKKLKHLTRGTGNVIAAIEVKDSGIGWAEPRDWSEAEFVNRFKKRSVGPYSNGFRAVMADGSVQFIEYDRGLDSVLKMFRIANDK